MGLNPVRVGYFSSGLCIYIVFRTVQTHEVLSMVLCTIKSPWRQSIRVGRSPDFGLLSVAILHIVQNAT